MRPRCRVPLLLMLGLLAVQPALAERPVSSAVAFTEIMGAGRLAGCEVVVEASGGPDRAGRRLGVKGHLYFGMIPGGGAAMTVRIRPNETGPGGGAATAITPHSADVSALTGESGARGYSTLGHGTPLPITPRDAGIHHVFWGAEMGDLIDNLLGGETRALRLGFTRSRGGREVAFEVPVRDGAGDFLPEIRRFALCSLQLLNSADPPSRTGKGARPARPAESPPALRSPDPSPGIMDAPGRRSRVWQG